MPFRPVAIGSGINDDLSKTHRHVLLLFEIHVNGRASAIVVPNIQPMGQTKATRRERRSFSRKQP